ncbi:hypothetical protein KIH74_32555 [Kineosporia sp. J2-2]|uniref:Tetratricopeptide repeat protein n=1 Tax=Kineosporia corallincola TaxID=2835133 RepID=A0ABS5TSD0_9ACTN|nr:hypothetical protein [Kineosporia corallincola]MBT0773722.1 hypothetical protein [Kineosporia corallincola]
MDTTPARRSANQLLRQQLRELEMTYESLARAVSKVAAENGEVLRTNKSAVAHWIAGTEPAERTALYIIEALSRRAGRSISARQIGFRTESQILLPGRHPGQTAAALSCVELEHPGALSTAVYTVTATQVPLAYDPEPVSRLIQASSGRARIGAQDVGVVRTVTQAFASADEILGGGHGLSTVATYLADTAAPMLNGRFASEQVRRDAFAAASELAWLLGWKRHDLGHEGAAQQYYLLGYQLAMEADPRAHAAWMMRAIAHQALSLNHPQHGLALLQKALLQSRGSLDGSTEALLYITQARAHAALQERAPAARALLAAEDALRRPADPQPSYSRLMGPPQAAVDSHTARTLTEIGDHAGAAHRHRAAFASWDLQTYPRVHLLTHMDLGDSLAAQAHADEAINAWNRAVDLAEGMDSGRSRSAFEAIRGALGVYRRRKVPGASGLAQRIRDLAS